MSSDVLEVPTSRAAPNRPRPFPRPQHSRWAGLDGLRAIAVAAVVTFHFAPSLLPGGFLGVDLFFVLSGYLITRMITQEYLGSGHFRIGRFYLRRARRLLPAVAALLVAVLAASVFWRDQLSTVRAATAAAAGYVSNWWLAYAHQSYFVATGRPSMLQHLWSLAVEEQFYLLWPLLALMVLRVRGGASNRVRSAHRLAVVGGALAAASTGWMAVLAVMNNVPYGADGSRLYYGTDTHGMGLLLGTSLGAMAAARIPGRPAPGPPRLVGLTDLVALSALAALGALFLRVDQFDVWLYRGGFLGVAALGGCCIAALTRRGSRLATALDIAPMRWVAARSYAIYLWHWPVTVVSRPGVDIDGPQLLIQLGRVLVTIALADLTYRWIEVPIRRGGLRSCAIAVRMRLRRVIAGAAPIGAGLATATMATMVLLAGSVLAMAPNAPTPSAQRQLRDGGGRNLHLRAAPAGRGSAVTTAPSRSNRSSPSSSPADQSTSSPPVRTSSPRPDATGRALRQRSFSAFGDSVMLGARPELGHVFPRGTLDAIEGRQPGPILDDVLTSAAHRRLGQVVAIGVGDNGLIDPTDLRDTLDGIRGHLVIVINNRVDTPWESPNNATIAAVTKHFPNVRLLDWYGRSASHKSWFYDGIHLTPTGASAYAAMIAKLAS